MSGPELLAVGPVIDPFARRGDPLAGGNRRRLTNNDGQLAKAARFNPQHAKAVFGIMEGHPLDEAGYDLKFGWSITSG